MSYRRLWVFVEGSDDERFFTSVIEPICQETYSFVKPFRYAQEKAEKVQAFLQSVRSMRSDYLLWGDINSLPCVTAKKDRLIADHGQALTAKNIIVVIKEIESWYLAGLDSEASKKLGIKVPGKTDELTKEDFDSLVPRKFDSRIDFMIEVLKRFSVATARKKNRSFDYFMSSLSVAIEKTNE